MAMGRLVDARDEPEGSGAWPDPGRPPTVSPPRAVNKSPRQVRRQRLHETPNCDYSLG